MAERSSENAGLASLRRQVESVERINREAGRGVPSGVLICLSYTEARGLLDVALRTPPESRTPDVTP